MSGSDTAASGLLAIQRSIEFTANNLANAGTGGYKREYALLATSLYQNLRPAGADTSTAGTEYPVGFDTGSGVQVVGTGRNFSQGSVKNTDNKLDVAIVGDGFFTITNPDGTTSYSRNGQFQLSGEGTLVNHLGYTMNPTVTVPQDATALSIGADGTVTALVSGSSTPTNLGQIEMARFINPRGLRPLGDNMFAESEASGAAVTGTAGDAGFGRLIQFAYEDSNVEAIKESTDLVRFQHIYRMNTTVFDTERKNHESLARIING